MPVKGALIQEHLEALARLGGTANGGVTRLSLDGNYLQVLERLSDWMREAGLKVRLDPAGNLIGRREGGRPDLPAIAIGSHIDTVIEGGRYDGTVGVLGGLEVIRALNEDGYQFTHPLELIVFLEEEGIRWGIPLLGSRLMSGILRKEEIYGKRDREGVAFEEAVRNAGLDPDQVMSAKREAGEFAAYLEMHIEQGGLLDSQDLPVGIVTGISGPAMMRIALKGQANHAGATPMHLRKDALVGAARLILEAKKIAETTAPVSVATVGQIQALPGASNVIPGEVIMSIDYRDLDVKRRDEMERRLLEAVQRSAEVEELSYEVLEINRAAPVVISERMMETISEAFRKNEVPIYKLPSGAGHDAQVMSLITEVGMIFIHSREGISHSPEEYSTIEDITLGTKVLYDTVVLLAERGLG